MNTYLGAAIKILMDLKKNCDIKDDSMNLKKKFGRFILYNISYKYISVSTLHLNVTSNSRSLAFQKTAIGQ